MFRKLKGTQVFAPGEGKILSLSEVPDPVFSEKKMGDGMAFEPTSSIIRAPMDGKITLISPTKHAFGMENDKGVELLVHIGIDTVNLDGEGFKVLHDANTHVKQGTPIIEVDLDFIKSQEISIVTPIVIVNQKEISFDKDLLGSHVSSDTEIFKVL